ncbi:copper amine oxidase N-terminal domain-containing protein (plasmid) [Aneurinibacillus thermoaerophilus]|nr:copper amine oxidase N-terminal domain-containing protein [Aneurinibacillus thermoaerophilus]QYY44784.1 copper amine oxidase N-terminal domain-containing protein [Aneurinibacillus thermoaerophilus]
MKKIFLALGIICSSFVVALPTAAAQLKPLQTSSIYQTAHVQLSFEGEEFDLPKKLIYARDELMFPAKSFLDMFDVKSTWNAKTKTFTVIDGEVISTFQVGNKIAYIGGEKIEMDEPPVIINGTLYVEAAALIVSIYCIADWIGPNILDIRNYVESENESQNTEYITADPFDTEVNYN